MKIRKLLGNFALKSYIHANFAAKMQVIILSPPECTAAEFVDKAFCDSPITLEEIVDAINMFKMLKSPGNDGLTLEFYKLFGKKKKLFY